MINNTPADAWHRAAQAWHAADAAARMLEDTKSCVFAKRCLDMGEMPVSRAEQTVKASDSWADHQSKITAARTEAERLRIEMKYYEMRYWDAQSRAATERTEARL